jgi:hypothetical protein
MTTLEFLFWNIVLLVLISVIVRSRDFTVIAVSYLIALWTLLTQVITKPVTLAGRLMNTTEYLDASNRTIVERSYETFSVPQNWLDLSYTVLLAVLTLYAVQRLLLTDLGRRMERGMKRWFGW